MQYNRCVVSVVYPGGTTTTGRMTTTLRRNLGHRLPRPESTNWNIRINERRVHDTSLYMSSITECQCTIQSPFGYVGLSLRSTVQGQLHTANGIHRTSGCDWIVHLHITQWREISRWRSAVALLLLLLCSRFSPDLSMVSIENLLRTRGDFPETMQKPMWLKRERLCAKFGANTVSLSLSLFIFI